MPDINRSAINLPPEVSGEILQKTQEQSAVMQLARAITLPGQGVSIPVITGDPTAEWVEESAKKPVSNPTVSKKTMTPYKLAVIETFSMEFTRDAATLYDALIGRLPLSLAKVFDSTVFGGTTKPGDNFDQLSACTAQSIKTDAYKGLVAADADIADHDGITNGYVLSPKGRAVLLSAVDGQGRPLFINSVAEGAIPQILSAPTYSSKGAYVAGTPNTLGFAGDWTQAIYGVVNGMQISISDQATVNDINLWQQNMVAIRAEMEIGFRADTTVFNKLTDAAS
ncbi:MAG: phage major capsid protein [Syntrophomonadaceae bacterium]|jgi:HK97 family phage major capsid protein